MNGGMWGIGHAKSLALKMASTEFQRSPCSCSSRGRAKTKKTVESGLQKGLAQQWRVSELQCCNFGRWGREGSNYVVDEREQSSQLGCCTLTSTAENMAVCGTH